MERKWVVVAFGDILGFGAWSRRAANPPEVRDPFIVSFYAEVEAFLMEFPCAYAKYLGDGFMLVKELPLSKSSDKSLLEFVQGLRHLTKNVLRLVKSCGEPPPDNFRMRVSTGYATKFFVTDPNDKKRRIPEYVSYIVNLAQRLLEISPEIPFICTESTVKLFHAKRKELRICRLVGSRTLPRGVDSEDIEGLRIVEI